VAAGHVQVAVDGAGKDVDADSLTSTEAGTPTVYRQNVVVADPTTYANKMGVSAAGEAITRLGLVPTYTGRASTFRTPGRAGTAGQKIFAIHNATGSTKVVHVNKIAIDLACTVVKAITVLPPLIRAWKVTVLPTNGTALTKVALDSSLTSSASITVFGDSSADGTSSGTALTATLPAGTILTEEYAPRFITAAGYEPFDRTVFFDGDTYVTLRALEGIVVFLDYVAATQNPITDMWAVSCEWDEF
jgi:hypothetical protein